jgi:hypothetical protein
VKKLNQWSAQIFYGGLIAVIAAVFVWIAHSVLLAASLFFVLAAVYAFFLFRVVWRSARASMVMHFAMVLVLYSLLAVEDGLDVPAAASWSLGIIAGAVAGGYKWSGKRSGSEVAQKRERNGESFSGGWHIALINAACAIVLMGIGVAHLALQSPTAPVAAVLTGALVAGWALFRFPPSLQARNMLLLVIPVEFFLLIFVGGNTGQQALPFAWAYGTLAGILLGGRYWSGPKIGEPRPPFNVQAKRRRKRKRKPRSKQKQKQTL